MIQSASRLRGVELGVAHKLRPIGVFASVGHGQSARAGVAKFAKRALLNLRKNISLGPCLQVLVLELVSIDGLPTTASVWEVSG